MNSVPDIGKTVIEVVTFVEDFHDADEAWGGKNGARVNLVADEVHVLMVPDEVHEEVQLLAGHRGA